MRPVYLLDNFDSFTYNLVDQFRALGHEVRVFRNSVPAEYIKAEMEKCAVEPVLVLSPGPGNPSEAGCLIDLIRLCRGKFPIIGICLGHQAICQYYGADIVPAKEIVHGKTSLITHNGKYMFDGFRNPLPVARYHSLVATNLPQSLEVVAQCDGMAMAVVNREDRVVGFQFHPESVMSTDGAKLLAKTIEFVSKERVNIKELVGKLYLGQKLTRDETIKLFSSVFEGDMDPIMLGAVLTSLKLSGESPEEIAGAANAMLSAATPFGRLGDYEVGEIVGTGGDGQNTINISSMSAVVASTLGLHVAKHGNRSVSSLTGASDILRELGVNITMSPRQSALCLDRLGLTFLFAPVYHKGMRYAAPVRAAMGTRTIFNVLGPLTNPSHPDYMVLGVYTKALIPTMVEVLKQNGMKRALVVYGDGLDEIALHGPTDYAELHSDGTITTGVFTPEDFGLTRHTIADIKGGAPEVNRALTEEILQGHGTSAQNDSIAANAGALLYLGGKVKTIKEGATMVLACLKSGKPYNQLMNFATLSHQEG